MKKKKNEEEESDHGTGPNAMMEPLFISTNTRPHSTGHALAVKRTDKKISVFFFSSSQTEKNILSVYERRRKKSSSQNVSQNSF